VKAEKDFGREKEEIMKAQERRSQLKRVALRLFAASLMAFMVATATFARTQPPATRDQAHYEAWLNQQVRHSLLTLPWYGVFDNLEYKVQGTQVTLYGQVVRPVTKSDAAGTVKRLEGVTKVVNDIQVLPISFIDNHIRLAEYRAIFSEPQLSRYAMGANPSIHIIVDNGHVTLEGVVDNATDRNVATIRAQGVPDVFSVTNHIRIA
jgi:hyperosmotically inducible periplasmic protein